nr:unnamed protein product [Haemonchus contortus]
MNLTVLHLKRVEIYMLAHPALLMTIFEAEEAIARFTCIGACIIYATVTLSLNARLLIEWKRLSRENGVPKHKHHDKGLLLYALLVFTCAMMICLQQVIKLIATLTGNTSLGLWISLQVGFTSISTVST